MKKIIKYLKGYRIQSFLGPLFKLLEAIMELIVPLVVASIINNGINGDYGIKYVIKMVLILIALGVLGLIFSIIAQYFSAKAAVGFSSILREKLFAKINSLSYQELDELGTSSMITIMTSDVNQIQNGVNLFLRLFLRSPFVVFGALLMAFMVNVKAGLVFSIVIPILLILVFLIIILTKRKYHHVQENLDEVVLKTRENINGVRVVRAFNKEKDEESEYKKSLVSLRAQQKKVSVISTLLNPLTYVVINIAIIFVLGVAKIEVSNGVLLQGEVVALYNYMTQILVELIKLANLIITLSKALASGSRIANTLELEPTLKVSDTLKKCLPYISFQNVSFSYHTSGQKTLKNISFQINKGEIIGIIGGTGSGKTSLVNLLAHFYDTTEGDVFINHQNVSSIDNKILRQIISIVPQKAVLFSGTIRSNLCWRHNEASDEELYEALEVAQALKLVKNKENGLDAVVEQGGRNFSGGERQRLTIARSLVGYPEIIIFDDSSSALDFLTDAALRKALQTLANQPTIFVVSQRTSSLMHTNKIIVLDDGEMVGFGDHDELMKNCKVYQEIYDSQFKEEVDLND